MTITMVTILNHIRKNPGISKEQIAKNLKLTEGDVSLVIKALQLKQLITLDARERCEPVLQMA